MKEDEKKDSSSNSDRKTENTQFRCVLVVYAGSFEVKFVMYSYLTF